MSVQVPTDHGPTNKQCVEQLKTTEFKRILLYHDDQVWPQPRSGSTARLFFFGSFQETVQQLPHACLRVRWPLGVAPSVIFNSEGATAVCQSSEAHWFPNQFKLWARKPTTQEQTALVRSGVARNDKT